jgi:hypothetical protein
MTIDAVGAVGAATTTPTTSTAQIQMLQERQRLQDQQNQAQREQRVQDQDRAQADLKARADQARLAADRADQQRVQQQNGTQRLNGRTDLFI